MDGSWVMWILYPLLVGVLFGDVGLGVVALGLASLLRAALRDTPDARWVSALLARSAVLTVVFGVLYGEYFDRSWGPVLLGRVSTVQLFAVIAAVGLGAHLVALLVLVASRLARHQRLRESVAPAAHFASMMMVCLGSLLVYASIGGLLELLAGPETDAQPMVFAAFIALNVAMMSAALVVEVLAQQRAKAPASST